MKIGQRLGSQQHLLTAVRLAADQLVGDVCYQKLAAEGEEWLQRAEINPERRTPRREVPAAYRHDNQVRKALCGDAQ